MNPKTAREAEAEEFGRKLRGFGINLIVKDVLASVNFLREVLQMKVHRANKVLQLFNQTVPISSFTQTIHFI